MIMGTLVVLDRFSKQGADKVQAFFNPALNWIQRWLPLFYVPTLVVLPQAVQGIAGAPQYAPMQNIEITRHNMTWELWLLSLRMPVHPCIVTHVRGKGR